MVNPSLKEGVKRRERLICLLAKFFVFRIPYINTLEMEKKLLFSSFIFKYSKDFVENGFFHFFSLLLRVVFIEIPGNFSEEFLRN